MKKQIKNVSVSVFVMLILVSTLLVACVDTREKNSTPVNVVVVDLTPTSITVVNNDTTDEYQVLEVRADGTAWQSETTITGLTPNRRYTVYARYKENEKYKAGDPFTTEVTTPSKYMQNAPAVSFTQADKTITVWEADAALEYSFDGGTTYGAANAHTYTENGAKVIKVRYKETNEYRSEESIINVNISDFYGGYGTESDPYLIGTLTHFNALVTSTRTDYYKLTADIDFTDTAIMSPVSLYFSHFDGNGHKFINPSVSTTSDANCGIFKDIGYIKNLTVENAAMSLVTPSDNDAEYYVGIIAGRARVIENCKVSGEINVTHNGTLPQTSYIGGIVGRLRPDRSDMLEYWFMDSFADVRIRYNSSPSNTGGTVYAGGLFGGDESGFLDGQLRLLNLSRSAAKVDIELLGTYGATVGGLCGSMRGSVYNCYVTGSIVTDGAGGEISMGGIVSQVMNGNIDGCYAAMNLSANGMEQNVFIGGIVRYASVIAAQTLSNCFFAGNIYITTGFGGKAAMSDSLTVGTLSALITATNCYHSNNLASPVVTSKTAAVSEETIKTIAWQRDTLLFDADVWEFADGEYPTLK
jgi:hypothetical protein